MHEQYVRVITPEAPPTEEVEEVCHLLKQCIDKRYARCAAQHSVHPPPRGLLWAAVASRPPLGTAGHLTLQSDMFCIAHLQGAVAVAGAVQPGADGAPPGGGHHQPGHWGPLQVDPRGEPAPAGSRCRPQLSLLSLLDLTAFCITASWRQKRGAHPAARAERAVRPSPPLLPPQEAASYEFEAVDGVVHVWADPSRRKLLFQPPGTATEFFSDMQWWVVGGRIAVVVFQLPLLRSGGIAPLLHGGVLHLGAAAPQGPQFVRMPAAPCRRMLKVIALGQVRSFTHQRLLLLEQKFNLHVMLNAGERPRKGRGASLPLPTRALRALHPCLPSMQLQH